MISIMIIMKSITTDSYSNDCDNKCVDNDNDNNKDNDNNDKNGCHFIWPRRS